MESIEEMARIAARARAQRRRARVSIRVNPGIVIDTHRHVATGHDEAKFGIPLAELGEAMEELRRHAELSLVGLSSHIGSMQTATAPYAQAARLLFDAAR